MTTTHRLVPVDNASAPPLEISARMRSQLVYFMTPADEPQVPPLHRCGLERGLRNGESECNVSPW